VARAFSWSTGVASAGADGCSGSPSTPPSRRKGGDVSSPRNPLATLALSPANSQLSGQGGSPWLSDSVVSEHANYLVRATATGISTQT